MSFRQLMDKWHWKPIRHCPGRFVLSTEQFSGPPRELLGLGVECREFRLSTARDPVVVARLDEGGLISYKHRDGAYLHTLNTREGFERKLIQLGIKPEEM